MLYKPCLVHLQKHVKSELVYVPRKNLSHNGDFTIAIEGLQIIEGLHILGPLKRDDPLLCHTYCDMVTVLTGRATWFHLLQQPRGTVDPNGCLSEIISQFVYENNLDNFTLLHAICFSENEYFLGFILF
jgi:hypothetical protein